MDSIREKSHQDQARALFLDQNVYVIFNVRIKLEWNLFLTNLVLKLEIDGLYDVLKQLLFGQLILYPLKVVFKLTDLRLAPQNHAGKNALFQFRLPFAISGSARYIFLSLKRSDNLFEISIDCWSDEQLKLG